MAKNYKSVEYSSTSFETKTYYKNQRFTNADEGISSIQYRSESLNFSDDSGPISYTTSGSHYNFLNGLLFDSGSFINGYNGVFTNKFYSSGSIIYIPQQYYGEQIKVNTFKLTDNSNSKTILIQDDGKGNLYSTNAHHSQSTTPASSSDNYVGNIQYQMGVVMITETGSWSGSNTTNGIDYTSVGTGDYTIEFNSTMPIHQNEIVCNISKNEFTATSNKTLWSGSLNELQPDISRSIIEWSPYATGIAFYDSPPNLYGQGASSDTIIYDIIPGQNTFIWNYPSMDLTSENIPSQIVSIINEVVYDENGDPIGGGLASSQYDGIWVGSLNRLEKGKTYTFNNNTTETFNWSLISFENKGVPLIVGNFPRPVKIDKESDLTIIIRYDT